MHKHVLIAYGTRYGSTEEISINFKQTLEENEYTVDLINLKAKTKTIPNISNYSGVLIGSGIRIGKWTKEAKKFLKTNVKAINDNKILVGIFLSSGEASDPNKKPAAVEKYLVKVFQEIGLDLGDHVLYDAFGGVFDLTATSKLGWVNKRMLKMAASKDPMIVLNERNDHRDWDQINTFLENFISRIE